MDIKTQTAVVKTVTVQITLDEAEARHALVEPRGLQAEIRKALAGARAASIGGGQGESGQGKSARPARACSRALIHLPDLPQADEGGGPAHARTRAARRDRCRRCGILASADNPIGEDRVCTWCHEEQERTPAQIVALRFPAA